MPTPSASSFSDRTAETLRLVLPLLSAHGSDFGPRSYALWCAYVEGAPADLKASLDEVVAARRRLSVDDTERLFASIVLAGEGRALDAARSGLLQVMGGMASAAGRTRETSETFLGEIERIDSSHEAHKSPEAAVARLAEQARTMTQSLRALNERLNESETQIEQLRAQLQRVRQEAMTDPLTGLANRRAFDEALAGLVARDGERRASAALSLVMVDVDHFKRINDDMGHLFGDRVLRAIADVLRANLKGRDMPARFGGEEFAVVLPGTPASAAYRVAEQLREAVAALRIRRSRSDEVVAQITISCGVATLAPGEDATSFIGRADAALYKAKKRGRNHVAVASGDPGA